MDIAIDMDGTIVQNKWPEVGPLRWGAKPVIRWLKRRGHTLILFTCREGKLLNEAIDYLYANRIYLHYYNENTRERIEQFGGDCRKISADLYLDDKGLFPGWWIVPPVVLWMEWRERRAHRNNR